MGTQRQFISDAAHELRTPLTILKGNTEVSILKSTSESTVLTKNLDEINHLISLTNDLLLIARFDSQVNVAIKKPINFSTQIKDCSVNLEPKAALRNIQLQLNLENDILINADVVLIKRVIYNIIDNAMKYTYDNSTIYISLLKNNLHQFQFIIKDEGPGISQDKLALIFERFYRVAEDRNKEVEGTGLGLSIVKSILQVHGYEIKVESEINKGSTFTISGEMA
jgi:signal transduction histidine kinase